MKRNYIFLMTLFIFLSGCASVKDAAEVDGKPTEAAPLTESAPAQIETATPAETRPAITETPTPTQPQQSSVKTATPTESQPTPVIPFNANLIGFGQQEAFSFQSSSGEEIIFWLYLPVDYNDSQKWPLLLSLHGFLGFNPSLEKVSGQSPLAWVDPDVAFPFIVIAPQAPSGSWAKYHDPMDELIEFLSESISIDPDAQFITGLSAGAVGAWQWVLALPDRFSGLAVVGGALSMNPNDPVPENICQLKDLPVWIAHSESDQEVPIEASRVMVTALKECGSTVTHFITYTDLNHSESIRTAYAGPELYDWMLGFIK